MFCFACDSFGLVWLILIIWLVLIVGLLVCFVFVLFFIGLLRVDLLAVGMVLINCWVLFYGLFIADTYLFSLGLLICLFSSRFDYWLLCCLRGLLICLD